MTFAIVLPPYPCGKNPMHSQINPGTEDENKISKVHAIKILLDSGASASIVRKDVLHKRHRIQKKKEEMVNYGRDL